SGSRCVRARPKRDAGRRTLPDRSEPRASGRQLRACARGCVRAGPGPVPAPVAPARARTVPLERLARGGWGVGGLGRERDGGRRGRARGRFPLGPGPEPERARMTKKRRKTKPRASGYRAPQEAAVRAPERRAPGRPAPEPPRVLGWLSRGAGDSGWPSIPRSIGRGLVVSGSSPALLAISFLFVFGAWIGLVALGLEGPP